MLKKLENKIINRWETCCPAGAHLFPIKWHRSEQSMFNRYKRLVTKKININNNIIIDYGCGGGYLGKYLLKNFNIKKYIGYDIAQRSVNRTKKQLKKYKNIYIQKVKLNQIPDFNKMNPDVFISLACLLHFPTQEYLNRFLNKVNNCKAKFVILEIRDKNQGTKFRKNIYKTFLDGNQACYTNKEYISNKLNNYKLIDFTDSKSHSTKCQVLYFTGAKK